MVMAAGRKVCSCCPRSGVPDVGVFGGVLGLLTPEGQSRAECTTCLGSWKLGDSPSLSALGKSCVGGLSVLATDQGTCLSGICS